MDCLVPAPFEERVPIDLRALLQPFAVETFLERHWERAPVLVPSQAERLRLARWPAVADLQRLLLYGCFQRKDLALASPTGSVFDGLLDADGRADVGAVFGGFAAGHTVVFNRLCSRLPELAVVARGLEASLGHEVRINGYLGPRGGQGFPRHFDPVEAFVLQLDGEKTWRVYPRIFEAPMREDLFPLDGIELGPPILEARLRPGDLLYVPRGFPHVAYPETRSLHLTIGVRPRTWSDALIELVRAAARNDARLRAAVPAAGTAPAAVREHLGRLLASLAEDEDAVALVTEPRPREDAPAAVALGFEDPRAGGDPWLRTTARARGRLRIEGVELVTPDERIELSPELVPSLELIASRDRFRASELSGLGDEHRCGLLVLLMGRGLIEQVS